MKLIYKGYTILVDLHNIECSGPYLVNIRGKDYEFESIRAAEEYIDSME